MAWTWRLSSSGTGEPQLKQCAETLATLLAAEPPAADKLVSTLQELPLSTTPEQVVNYRLPRQSSRTAVHLAASKGLWQCLEVLLKHGGEYWLFVLKQALLFWVVTNKPRSRFCYKPYSNDVCYVVCVISISRGCTV